MDETNDYYYDFTVEDVTNLQPKSQTLPDLFPTPSISVFVTSNIKRYDWGDHYNHSAVNAACVIHADLVRIDRATQIFHGSDLDEFLMSTERFSTFLMNVVNPNITRGSKVHDDVLDTIFSVINDIYSGPNRPRVFTNLRLWIVVNEHVLNQCECLECRAIRESAALAEERRLTIPASESSIEKLKRVRVEAAADLEEKNNEERLRKRRKTSEKEGEKPSDGDDCTICCDQFTARSFVAEMPCLHVFHRPCIEKWLRICHRCPICRYEMDVN